MNRRVFLTLCLMTLMSVTIFAQSRLELKSPDGRFVATFGLTSKGEPTYNLFLEGKPVVKESKMGFYLLNQKKGDLAEEILGTYRQHHDDLIDGFKLIGHERDSFDETWQTVWGEEEEIRNNYNELLVELQQEDENARRLNIRFRLFDDGLGFRYEFPDQDKLVYFAIKEEATEFAMAGDHTAWWIPGDYDTQEYNFGEHKLSQIAANYDKTIIHNASQFAFSRHGVQTPLQMKSDDGLYINIHEAALIEFPAMHLELDEATLTFRAHLTPDATGAKGRVQTPFNTPWRTLIVGNSGVDILSSRMTYNLNEPCKLEDTSWIKPMKYMGVWWEMITGKSHWSYTNDLRSIHLDNVDYTKTKPHGRHGATTENVLRHIDFAAKHGFDGVLVEGWNVGWEDWFGHQKDYVFDFQTPYPDFDVDAVREHAKAKGIKMIMHHETSSSIRNYERHLDDAFKFMVKNGYPAVKTGYVGDIVPYGEHHYGQWLVNHYLYVVKKAAEYKITINAHESVHMTGLSRTYPNLLSQESAKGQEFQTGGNTINHMTILPFGRLIGGPMDYTPGVVQMSMNRMNPDNPNVAVSTIGNQLGMYLTMYTPLQMAADFPEHYEERMDAFQFIKEVPVEWSESKYLEAEPGRYVTVARREKGTDNWYIGNVSGTAHPTAIKLNFLKPGVKYEATIYEDGKRAHATENPYDYNISTKKVTNKSTLKLNAVAGGGFAVSIRPINK